MTIIPHAQRGAWGRGYILDIHVQYRENTQSCNAVGYDTVPVEPLILHRSEEYYGTWWHNANRKHIHICHL